MIGCSSPSHINIREWSLTPKRPHVYRRSLKRGGCDTLRQKTNVTSAHCQDVKLIPTKFVIYVSLTSGGIVRSNVVVNHFNNRTLKLA